MKKLDMILEALLADLERIGLNIVTEANYEVWELI